MRRVVLIVVFGLGLHFSKSVVAEERAAPAAPHEEGEGAEKPRRPDKIGPFVLQSEKSHSSIRFGFVAQPLVQLDSKDKGPDADREDRYAMTFRRIREILKGSVLSDDFTYALQLNTAPGSLELIDLNLSYRFTPAIELSVGQSKIPFTRYRMNSLTTLTFADWALTTKYFGAERQRGFTIHNGDDPDTAISYAFGVYTGENARASQGIGLAMAYGETVDNQSDLVDPAVPGRFHPEMVVHLRYNHRGIDTAMDTDLKHSQPTFAIGLSAAYDLRPEPHRDFSQRLAPEVLFKAHGFSFCSVFYVGFSEKEGERMAYRHAMTGALFQTSYIALNRVELSARYAFVDVSDDVLRDSRNLAAEKITGIEDDISLMNSVDTTSDPVRALELEDAIDANADAISALRKVGVLDRDHELTFGLNVLIIGTSLKWQNDISWLKHELISDTRNDIRFRSQITLSF